MHIIEESLENFCIEWKEKFSSTIYIWMYSSGSSMWWDDISEISYTYEAAGEGVTPRRLSSIRIDCEEDSASSSSWTTSSKRVEVDTFE